MRQSDRSMVLYTNRRVTLRLHGGVSSWTVLGKKLYKTNIIVTLSSVWFVFFQSKLIEFKTGKSGRLNFKFKPKTHSNISKQNGAVGVEIGDLVFNRHEIIIMPSHHIRKLFAVRFGEL